MRASIPAELLQNAGHTISITPEEDGTVDLNIFSKHWNIHQDQGAIDCTNTITCFDVCDDHFDRELGPHYSYMCDKANIVTCNTDRMQERIYECTGRLAHVVPDPVTFPEGYPRYNKDPDILWFGNAVNFETILPYAQTLPNLTIVTNVPEPDVLPNGLKWFQWQPGLVEDLIESYDIVLLPRSKYEWAQTKSPNRCVDAINAGAFVISDFPEVYGEFEDFIYLGDIQQGLKYYKENSGLILEQIAAGQRYVDNKYNNSVVLRAWERALKSEGDNE
jgi:hypothetical protein